MDVRNRPSALLVALAAGTLLMVGCDQRAPADSASAKLDRTADKVGSAVSNAADKTATTVSNAADKTATVAEDAAITAKVKAAILAEPGLKTLQINVDTNGATVTLSGNVDNADLKERAKQIASNTSGVKGVVDQLAVKSS
ncbi:MAG TPA: BON domain-containing protein [Casimicrobiaceae bacterium]|jgi:hyperosmotically inducible protein|nr:BON domain-containing protein [Casimicrobiaceae bacterium]